jgi:hypothetical protein
MDCLALITDSLFEICTILLSLVVEPLPLKSITPSLNAGACCALISPICNAPCATANAENGSPKVRGLDAIDLATATAVSIRTLFIAAFCSASYCFLFNAASFLIESF